MNVYDHGLDCDFSQDPVMYTHAYRYKHLCICSNLYIDVYIGVVTTFLQVLPY